MFFSKRLFDKNLVLFFVFSFLLSLTAHAAGLDDATKALTGIQTWLYGFIGVAAIVYLGYNVVLALAERKEWGDVAIALAKTAGAGGALAGATWALALFK